MIVLGIETSCDETSASIVEEGRRILSNVILSQEKYHRPFRGIVPEIASRLHLEKINEVVHQAIEEAKIRKRKAGSGNVNAIAVTVGPGLVGSLLVGKMTASAMGWIWDCPVIGVNHLEAHLFSALLNHPKLVPPFVGLVVSGGHSDLVLVNDFGSYKVLGRTRDDAAGECFDKVAKILGLGYPGGPLIDKIAKNGDERAINFPKPYLHGSWDFSFSGLKTAVLYYVKGLPNRSVRAQKPSQPAALDSQKIYDICASFQSSVVDVLIAKTLRAAEKFKLKKIAVGGGVSANSLLRKRFLDASKKKGLELYFPSKELCTDNAAMVAAIGTYKLKRKLSDENHSVNPSLPIENWR